MKKLLTVLLSVLMVLTLGVVSISAEEEEAIDINTVGYRLLTAEAGNKEYNGKRQGADITFKTFLTRETVTGLEKFSIDLEKLSEIDSRRDLAEFLIEHAFEGTTSDYIVVYTKEVNGRDVIVEPKDADTYTATIVLRPLTALFQTSFLRNTNGLWYLSQVKHVDYVIDPSDDYKVNAPVAKDLTVNGKPQVLANDGSVEILVTEDADLSIPVAYSLDGNYWSYNIDDAKLQKQASGSWDLLYKANVNVLEDGSLADEPFNSNYVVKDGSIKVAIKPTPVRPYTPVVTGE